MLQRGDLRRRRSDLGFRETLTAARVGDQGTVAQTARRWRAHPLGSARADEGTSDGAITARFHSAAAARYAEEKRGAWRRERKGRREWLGFRGVAAASAFCISDPRAQPSDEIRRSPITGLKMAQAGSQNPGPGPSCGLGAGSARVRELGLGCAGAVLAARAAGLQCTVSFFFFVL